MPRWRLSPPSTPLAAEAADPQRGDRRQHADPGRGRERAHDLAEAERVGEAHRERADRVAAAPDRAHPVAHGRVGAGGNTRQHEPGTLTLGRPQLGRKRVLREQQWGGHPSRVADFQLDPQDAADGGSAAVEMALRGDAVASAGEKYGGGGGKGQHEDADPDKIALVEDDACGQAQDPGGDEGPAARREAGERLPDVAVPLG